MFFLTFLGIHLNTAEACLFEMKKFFEKFFAFKVFKAKAVILIFLVFLVSSAGRPSAASGLEFLPAIGPVEVHPSENGYTGANQAVTAQISEPSGRTIASCKYQSNPKEPWRQAVWDPQTKTCTASMSDLKEGFYEFRIKGVYAGINGEEQEAASMRSKIVFVDRTAPEDFSVSVIVKSIESKNAESASGETANADAAGAEKINVICGGAEDEDSGVNPSGYDFEYKTVSFNRWRPIEGCTNAGSMCDFYHFSSDIDDTGIRCRAKDNAGNAGDWAYAGFGAGVDYDSWVCGTYSKPYHHYAAAGYASADEFDVTDGSDADELDGENMDEYDKGDYGARYEAEAAPENEETENFGEIWDYLWSEWN